MWVKAITRTEKLRIKPVAKWRPLALTMLSDIHAKYTAADEGALEALYADLSSQANVFKITRRNRFEGLNVRIASEIRQRFGGFERIYVHDVGASSAITSLELYDCLNHVRPTSVLATDFFDRLDFVTPPESGWTVAFDAEGRAVQAVGYGFALALTGKQPRRYPVNALLARSVAKRIVPTALDQYADAKNRKTLPLFHPLCMQRAAIDQNFSVGRFDVFTASPNRFHLIRAMNCLNRCYFSEVELRKALRLCSNALEEGGLLLVGRSVDEEDGRVTASLYEKIGGKLTRQWDENEGSELNALVDEATPEAV